MPLLYTSMLIPGFLPDALMITIIASTLKIRQVICLIITITDPLLVPQLLAHYLSILYYLGFPFL